MTEAEARAWVAGHVSRETLEALDVYVALVCKWQRAINLVSRSTLSELFSRHVADSLQVFLLRPSDTGSWLDIGSGAGFPGLVCAIAAKQDAPGLRFTLIESDQRKATFLREVARHVEIDMSVLSDRIENVPPQNADILSARALSPLEKLCEYGNRHLSATGQALFPKGRNHVVEQRDADRLWKMKREIIPSKTDPESVIYRIGDLARV